jgi:hypothetical protein
VQKNRKIAQLCQQKKNVQKGLDKKAKHAILMFEF